MDLNAPTSVPAPALAGTISSPVTTRGEDATLFVVLNQRENVDALQFLAALEKSQLDSKGRALDDSSQLLDELYRGGGSASRSQQIVTDDHPHAFLYCVFVNLQRVGAVFKGIRNAGGFCGELFGFADGHKTSPETIGQRGSEDKTSSFDACDYVNPVAVVMLTEAVDERVETLLVFQQRGEIVEENTRLRIIGNFADQLLQFQPAPQC